MLTVDGFSPNIGRMLDEGVAERTDRGIRLRDPDGRLVDLEE